MQDLQLISIILASTLAVSVISLIGILLLSSRESFVRKAIQPLISFSTGALLGDVFIHMLPEIVEEDGFMISVSLLILSGILFSFILEKFIHWRHCHVLPSEHHYHPVGIMNLVGDAIHNLLDGVLIAASFFVSIPVGIATTIAVTLHEIPQEMSDFALLVYSGFSKKKAILLNVLFGLSGLVGAVVIIISHDAAPALSTYLLPITAGNFLYIAGSDLIPELHKETGPGRSAKQFVGILCGIAFMAVLTMLE